MLAGNDFIELLYLPISDDIVNNMMNILKIERLNITQKFKEDGYISIESKTTKTEVFFTDIVKYNKNINKNQTCNIVFSGMFFQPGATIPMPFSLQIGDSIDTVIQKLGKNPNYINKHFPTKTWHLQRNDGKDYLLYVDFKEDDYAELANVAIQTYDDTIKYLNNSEFVIKSK